MSTDPATEILEDPRFAGQPITWEVTPAAYVQIRHAWLTHVAAEERLFTPYSEAEWHQQMDTMLSVFSPNCVMEIVPTAERWEGHDGAVAFYQTFIPSFSDMTWVPQTLLPVEKVGPPVDSGS